MPAQSIEQTLVTRLEEKEARRRPLADRKAHLLKHKFEGLEYMRDDVPIFMPITPETPPITIAMWTSISLFCLCLGWFSCSLFGYTLCRKWKSVPPPDQTASLKFIFNTRPLNRWAINLAFGFGMMLYFATSMFIFIWLNLKIVRERQNQFAIEEGWVLAEGDKRRKDMASQLCCL